MSFFSSLKREQKEAIGLLQIGTLLEYFDLMLYVHMAVLLNELFFPKTEPHTAALLTALTFCSTFVLRPFGALICGHIGDTFGRKPTVVITTSMMAMFCVLMANLPTSKKQLHPPAVFPVSRPSHNQDVLLVFLIFQPN